MFCGQCGKKLPEGARFCSSCGAGTGDKLSYAQPQPVKEEKAARKFSLKMIIPVCVAAVAAVTVLGVILLRVVRGGSNSEKHIYYGGALALLERESGNYMWWDDFDGSGVIGEYRSDGKPIWELYIGSRLSPEKKLYEYDARGNLVKVHTNTGTRCTILEYDKAGNLTRILGTGDGDFAPEGEYDVYEYDKAGNRIKETSYFGRYNYDGEEGISYYKDREYEYDAAGNRTRETYYNSEGSITYQYEYEYDAAGNRTRETYYNSEGSFSHYNEYEYEYDAAGNLTRETCYDGRDGSITSYREYEYDKSGNLTRENRCNADGSISSYSVYRYGKAGNLLYESAMYYIPEEGEWNSYETEYNEDGNIIKEQSNYYGKIRGYVCEYDKQGRQTKAAEYKEDGSLGDYYIYKYDSAGNFKKIASYDENDTLLGYEAYEYDEDDNITKVTSSYYGVQSYTTIKYDKNGIITQYNVYDESEELQYYLVREYDKNGKYIGMTQYDEDGNIMNNYDR